METTAALLFTAYMVPVNLVDNILKPVVMARGLSTPMIVILIGVLALVRKIIVTDLSAIAPAALAAEAALILALGITYWLMRERDDRGRLGRTRRRARASE